MYAADLPFLLYAKASQIRSVELDANVSTASHARSFRPVVVSSRVTSMDFDSREGYVYWVEQPDLSARRRVISVIQAKV